MNTFFLAFFFTCAYCASINVQQLSQARQNIASASLSTAGIGMFAGGYYYTGSSGSEVFTASDKIDIYNVNTNSWSLNTLPNPAYDVGSASLDNKGIIIFAGGTDSTNFFNTVQVYTASNNQWTSLTVTQARAGIAAAALPNQGKILLVGGYNGATYYNIIDVYDSATGQITTSPKTLSLARSRCSIAVSQNLAFFAGGITAKSGSTPSFSYTTSDVIDIYNAGTDVWSTAQLSKPRAGIISFVINGNVIFLGGFSSNILNAEGAFDGYISGKWTTEYFGDLPLGLTGGTVAILNSKNTGIIFGGTGQGNNNLYIAGFNQNLNIQVGMTNYGLPNTINSAAIVLDNQGIILFGGGGVVSQSLSSISSQTNNVAIYAICGGGTVTINPLTCTACPIGSYCPYTLNPITCPAGNYCPAASNFFSVCPAGTYNPNTGSTTSSQCLLTPAGKYCGYTGATNANNCGNCDPGEYCPAGTSTRASCPSNNYCPTGSTKIPCPAGSSYEGISAITAATCVPCSVGNYCPSGRPETPCPPGTFTNSTGTAQCTNCPEGYACALGSITPNICPQMTYSASSQPTCSNCPVGQFTNGPGSASCFPCPSDKFKGWWCASDSEKIIFVFITLGSIGSGLATAWKLYKFYNVRKMLLTNEGLPITWRNVVFVEQAIEQKKKTEMTEIGGGDETPILQADQLRKVQDTIFTMQTKITLLEAK